MALEWGRCPQAATVRIDREKCNVCGACVAVCRGYPLYLADGEVRIDQTRGFGCIGCGGCLSVCPTGAISVEGRDLHPADVLDLPPAAKRADYERLYNLLLSRRSVREFKNQPVSREMLERIIAAAATSPMGVPPSEVGALVFDTPAKVQRFVYDQLRAMEKMKWFFSAPMLMLMRPLMGKEGVDAFKLFIVPIIDKYLELEKKGVDWFFYGAPAAMFFYASSASDPADAYIAATNAMNAGVALGLGACMLGLPGYVAKYSKDLRRKYALPEKIQPGLAVIFGHPKYKLRHALQRRFAEVRYV